MDTLVELDSTSKRPRGVARLGDRVVLRASLPPLAAMRRSRAVTPQLEALSLWTDRRLCVAPSAATLDDCFRFDPTDELSVYDAVGVMKRTPHRRRAAEGPACQFKEAR